MPQEERFKEFDYIAYKKARNFWDKVERVCRAAQVRVDRTSELFSRVEEMRVWRNLVTHSAPYLIPQTEIENTTSAPIELHKPHHLDQYPRLANKQYATKFYSTAYDYFEFLKLNTGLEPRASVTYEIR
jgi:hypothetical protein